MRTSNVTRDKEVTPKSAIATATALINQRPLAKEIRYGK